MIQEGNLLRAISGSGVSKITIIDDAFDPPMVNTDNAGDLLQFLEEEGTVTLAKKLGAAGHLDKARSAIESSDYAADDLVAIVAAFYEKFVGTGDEKFNPGGIFSVQLSNINY